MRFYSPFNITSMLFFNFFKIFRYFLSFLIFSLNFFKTYETFPLWCDLLNMKIFMDHLSRWRSGLARQRASKAVFERALICLPFGTKYECVWS